MTKSEIEAELDAALENGDFEKVKEIQKYL